MKQLALALAALAAGTAFAQEIGTEITPVTPTSAAQQPSPPQPTAQPPQQPSGSGSAPRKDAGAGDGTRLSASKGDFGIRAGYAASAVIGPPAAAGFSAPSVGVAYFASDAFKLLVDLGVGFGVNNGNPAFAAEVGVGFNYMLRTPGDSLRPFIHVLANFAMGGQLNNPSITVGVQGGFGAEYFFAPQFAVNGRLLLAVPVKLSPSFDLFVLTVSPGVGATWYL